MTPEICSTSLVPSDSKPNHGVNVDRKLGRDNEKCDVRFG